MWSLVRARRSLLAVAIGGVLIALPSPAAAGSPTPPPVDSSTGATGDWGFIGDAEGTPAGRCRYGVTVHGHYYNQIYSVGVRAPTAIAAVGRAHQRIGFRLYVQLWDGGSWVKYARSTWEYKTATPDTAAAFKGRSLPVHYEPSLHTFRAKVVLRWFANDGKTVRGTANLYPDWNKIIEGNLPPGSQVDFCGGTTG